LLLIDYQCEKDGHHFRSKTLMLKNYFTIAWRNLMKSKVFSFINIFGLTTGITVCGMIFLFVMNEFSFDNFHANGDKIFRVMRSFDPAQPGVPWVAGPYAKALLNDFPGEIKQAVRVLPDVDLISYKDKSFNEKNVFLADSNFFTFFSFPLLKGDPRTALSEPNNIVLTESTAKRVFGDEDPMGKVIGWDKDYKLTVTGIAKDVPVNSHLNFDLIVPITGLDNMPFYRSWTNNNLFVYIQLEKLADQAAVERRLPAFMNKYATPAIKASGYKFGLALTPLKDVYFDTDSAFDKAKHGSKKVVYVFLSIATLILLIACINFMNLSTIRAAERSKEVGLRKVMGARRKSLAGQFIGESILLAALSCVLSVGLLQLLMPLYSDWLGYRLEVPWTSGYFYAFLLGTILVGGGLAGIYPAFILSAFSPIEALRGKLNVGKGGSMFRQTLVVVQFSISVFLITGTLIIARQMVFIKDRDLGYNQEQTLVVPLNDDLGNNLNRFKQDLLVNSGVASVSMMSAEPGGFFDEFSFEVEGQDNKLWKGRTEYADFDFVKTLGLKIIAGRDLSSQYSTDTTSAVLLNRMAAGALGWIPQQAVGKWIKNTLRDSSRRRVVGVVEDFNYTSLKEKIEPLVISPGNYESIAVIRLKSGNLQNGVEVVKKICHDVAPAYPFEYNFLDRKFDQLYRKDLREQSILTVFSGLAIVIAGLGLFGLASFTVVKRTKEIGVRKVLGSSVQNIILLLLQQLLKPVLVATLIATPVAYAVMHNWLQSFAYRTGLKWWIFVCSAGITVVIALITVSFRAVRAAMANPTKSLRSE
jgi:putative ABC transport system permease protein